MSKAAVMKGLTALQEYLVIISTFILSFSTRDGCTTNAWCWGQTGPQFLAYPSGGFFVKKLLVICLAGVFLVGPVEARMIQLSPDELREIHGQAGVIPDNLSDDSVRETLRQAVRTRREYDRTDRLVTVKPAQPDVNNPIDRLKNRVASQMVESTINQGINRVAGAELSFTDIFKATKATIKSFEALQKGLASLEKLE